MTRFAIIGLGYIAPRHIQAIEDVGGELVFGCDKNGLRAKVMRGTGARFVYNASDILDAIGNGTKIDYVSICTPNHEHLIQAMLFLKRGVKVIIEKPPVITSKDLDWLVSNEENANVVLQLRLHPELARWKEKIKDDHIYDVEMDIQVARDSSYFDGWKGDENLSGGPLFNIGVHYFDILTQLFGEPTAIQKATLLPDGGHGMIFFPNADVKWRLHIDTDQNIKQYRKFTIDGEELDFSNNNNLSELGLHTRVYQDILEGKGIKPSECCSAISLIEKIKECSI